MAKLNLSAIVDGPLEDVYEYVTRYGPDGPADDASFTERCGTVEERDGDTFVVREDVRAYPEDEPDLIGWRCRFEYPVRRTMVAIDSDWADRTDTFERLSEGEGVSEGTLWRVRWDTRSRGLKTITQYLAFRLATHKRLRRELMDPVLQHFKGLAEEDSGP